MVGASAPPLTSSVKAIRSPRKSAKSIFPNQLPSAFLATIVGFQHESLTVSVGDTITWTNVQNTAHTVTHIVSTDGDGSPQFQSGNFGEDGTFSHTFDTTGNFPYFCEIHPWMVGVVTVEPGPASSGVAETGGDPGY